MLTHVLNHVQGNLSEQVCLRLQELVARLPAGATILDLNCGAGRSTVVLGLGIKAAGLELEGVHILAADSHIINPISERPYHEGTVMRFLSNILQWRVAHLVIPVVCADARLATLIDKRSANMVLVQSPRGADSLFSADAVAEHTRLAIKALRKGGIIAVCPPSEVYASQSRDIVREIMRPNKDYTHTIDLADLQVYERA